MALGSALGGGASGALTGAKYGSFIPGIGTGVGAAIGGIGGFLGGLFGGKKKSSSSDSGMNYDAIRARALSPARATYQNALRNVERQRALQGGYSPGYNTMLSKLQREQNEGLLNASLGAEETIGKLKLAERQVPSDYQRKLSSIGGTMDLIGRGAGAASQLFDFNRGSNPLNTRALGGGLTFAGL